MLPGIFSPGIKRETAGANLNSEISNYAARRRPTVCHGLQNIQMAKEKTKALRRVTLYLLFCIHAGRHQFQIIFRFISSQPTSQKTAVQWRAAALNGVLQFYFTYMQNEAGMFILISHAANNGTKTNKLPQNDSIACDTLSHENMLVNGKKSACI